MGVWCACWHWANGQASLERVDKRESERAGIVRAGGYWTSIVKVVVWREIKLI